MSEKPTPVNPIRFALVMLSLIPIALWFLGSLAWHGICGLIDPRRGGELVMGSRGGKHPKDRIL